MIFVALTMAAGAIVADLRAGQNLRFRLIVLAAAVGGVLFNALVSGGGGMSADGCLLGAALAAALLAPVEHLDRFCRAAVTGWAIARIGCAVTFDHPGVMTRFGFRHNLGLYEAVWAAVFAVLPKMRTGTYTVACLLSFAALRFGLDQLREEPGSPFVHLVPLAGSLYVLAISARVKR